MRKERRSAAVSIEEDFIIEFNGKKYTGSADIGGSVSADYYYSPAHITADPYYSEPACEEISEFKCDEWGVDNIYYDDDNIDSTILAQLDEEVSKYFEVRDLYISSVLEEVADSECSELEWT